MNNKKFSDMQLEKAIEDFANAASKIKHPLNLICEDEDCPCCDRSTKFGLKITEPISLTLKNFKMGAN
jgi:hypothetical protein